MTNTSLIAKLMAADIVSFYQTIHPMNITQNRKDLKLTLAFREDFESSASYSWRDIHKSAFGGTAWDAPESPLKAELTKINSETLSVEEQIALFFEANRPAICAEVMVCMAEEGYENFAVNTMDGHLVIWSSIM